VDAEYIKDMLKNPDLQPTNVINRWIQGILTFDFELIHVPGLKFKGSDGLSRRPKAENKQSLKDDEELLNKTSLLV
jgi:hypothetical protein